MGEEMREKLQSRMDELMGERENMIRQIRELEAHSQKMAAGLAQLTGRISELEDLLKTEQEDDDA